MLVEAQKRNEKLATLVWLGGVMGGQGLERAPKDAVTATTPSGVNAGAEGGSLRDAEAERLESSPTEVGGVLTDWQTATTAQVAAGVIKVGVLRERTLGEFWVTDLGGVMKESVRGGSNSCILKTMGALLATQGYPEEV